VIPVTTFYGKGRGLSVGAGSEPAPTAYHEKIYSKQFFYPPLINRFSKMKDIQKLVALAKPYWRRVLVGVILSFLASAITGAIAWLVKPALDHVFVQRQYQYLKFIPVGLVFLYLLKGFFEFGQTYMMKSVGFKIVRDMRNDIYQRLLYFPVGYFAKESSGRILSKIINDVSVLSGTVSKVPVTFFLESSQVIIE
jgi:subfamily B ATP-binding cassette protein MsbA